MAAKPKNLIIIHLESISWQQVNAFPEAFPNLLKIAKLSQRYHWHISSATSTQMAMASLLHGNDYELDENLSLSNLRLANNEKSLFSLLKDKNYATKFFALNAYHHALKPLLSGLSECLPDIYGSNDFNDLNDQMNILFDTQSFAMYFWNMTTHIEQLKAFEPYASSLDDQLGAAYAVADQILARLFDQLEQRNLLDKTSIVIFGDHGEDYWTHGFQDGYLHGTAPYLPMIHTPLFLLDSSIAPTTINRLVSTNDIYPTCIQLLGLDEQLTFKHAGKSLLTDVSRAFVCSQNLLANQTDSLTFQPAKTYSITNHQYHLMVSQDGLEFFSHRLDPTNHCNLLKFFEFDETGTLDLGIFAKTHPHFHAAIQSNQKATNHFKQHFYQLRDLLKIHISEKYSFLESKGIYTSQRFDPEVFYHAKE